MSRHSRSSSAGSRASFNSDVTTPDVSEASDGDVMAFDDMHLMEEEEDDDFADFSDEFESDHSLNDDDVSRVHNGVWRHSFWYMYMYTSMTYSHVWQDDELDVRADDKQFNVFHELTKTEESYVQRISILVNVSTRCLIA